MTFDVGRVQRHHHLATQFSQRRAFVERDVVGLVALDFILWRVLARVMGVTLVSNVSCVHPDDRAANVPGLGVPGHMIANFESLCHDGTPPELRAPAIEGPRATLDSFLANQNSN